MADDDRAVRDKMALLEAEVKATAEFQRLRKETALAKVREDRAVQQAEQTELRQRQAEIVTRKKRPTAEPEVEIVTRKTRADDGDDADGLGSALELAGKANRVKTELARKPGKGEKSWMKSGLASTLLGPVGWLYAGSMREAVPASAVWLALISLASKILPTVLLLPVLMVALPLSGIAGVVYALQYNRHGGRQRLFDKEDKPKQLPGR
ncbi:MAG: uncharacterized protein JWO36_1098 [Myxococcales bacterium]|nr:uncharacterized protein [Myxococcales bacterium]